MQIVLSRCSGVTVLNIHRNLDAQGIQILRGCLDRLVAAGQTRAVLDFRPARHIYFKVLPELVTLADRYRAVGGWLAIAGLSDYLYSIFRLQGLEEEIPIYGSPEEAVTSQEFGGILAGYAKKAEVVALPVQPR